MKKICMYCIVLVTVCSSFLRCATKKDIVICTFPPPTPVVDPYPLKQLISGVVKNEQGDALPNATVQLNQQQAVKTDNAGKFSLETEVASAGATANLFIQYDGLVPAVRSYHAVMQHAFYDITLHPPVECCIKTDCFLAPVTAFEYQNGNTGINEELQGILQPLADSLKEHPFCSLRFTAYGKGNKPGSRADERLRQIQEFFTGKGVTESRIMGVKAESKMTDVIEIEVIRN